MLVIDEVSLLTSIMISVHDGMWETMVQRTKFVHQYDGMWETMVRKTKFVHQYVLTHGNENDWA